MDDFAHLTDDLKEARVEVLMKERGERRALATNAVIVARSHAGRREDPFTPEDSDILVGIMNLLDKVAGV